MTLIRPGGQRGPGTGGSSSGRASGAGAGRGRGTRGERFAQRAALRATGQQVPARPGPLDPAATMLRLDVPGARRAGAGGRWGIVLGGGGVLGASWLVGALSALEHSRGVDVRDAELIVGTSAGSVIGALLAAGVSVQDQRNREATPGAVADGPGEAMEEDGQPPMDGAGLATEAGLGTRAEEAEAARRRHVPAVQVDDDVAGGSRPQLPRLKMGSPAILRNNRGSLRQLPRTTILAGLAPTGRGNMNGVRRLIESVVPAGQWAGHPGFRAVTLDYETGRRVIFGAENAPEAGLSEAVAASCSIPGWFEPVAIGGRRYVDGGAWSATNADLLVDAGLDELFVLAPMVSLRYDTTTDVRARVERRLRVAVTRRCLAEARLVQTAGTAVTVIGPGPDELGLMGHNLMASSRRAPVLESGYRTTLAALGGPADEGAGPGEHLVDLTETTDAAEATEATGAATSTDQEQADH